jgi:hypothetical protein
VTVGELGRQHQAALERERQLRSLLDGVVSAEDVLRNARFETEAAFEALEAAWAHAEIERMDAERLLA